MRIAGCANELRVAQVRILVQPIAKPANSHIALNECVKIEG